MKRRCRAAGLRLHPDPHVAEVFLPLRSSAVIFGTIVVEAIVMALGGLFIIVACRGSLTGSMQTPTGERVLLADEWWQTQWLPFLGLHLLNFGLCFVVYFAGTIFGAAFFYQRVALQGHLDSFDVKLAGCFSAIDRDEIHASIAEMYARRGVNGLDSFNELVRTTLKEEILERIGQTLPYSTLLMLLLPAACLLFGEGMRLVQGTSAFSQSLCFVLLCTFVLVAAPCFCAVVLRRGARLARRSSQPDLRSFARRACLAITWTALRGVIEAGLTGAIPLLYLPVVAEFPEMVGLGHAPVLARRTGVAAATCLWSIAWVCMARRTFGSRARATANGRRAAQRASPNVITIK